LSRSVSFGVSGHGGKYGENEGRLKTEGSEIENSGLTLEGELNLSFSDTS
jgi:hypothetical protein